MDSKSDVELFEGIPKDASREGEDAAAAKWFYCSKPLVSKPIENAIN